MSVKTVRKIQSFFFGTIYKAVYKLRNNKDFSQSIQFAFDLTCRLKSIVQKKIKLKMFKSHQRPFQLVSEFEKLFFVLLVHLTNLVLFKLSKLALLAFFHNLRWK